MIFQLNPHWVIFCPNFGSFKAHICRHIHIPGFHCNKIGSKFLTDQVIDTEGLWERLRPGVRRIGEAVICIDKTPAGIVFKRQIQVQNQFLNGDQIQGRNRFGSIGIRSDQLVGRIQGGNPQNVFADQQQIKGRYPIDVVGIESRGNGIIIAFNQIEKNVIARWGGSRAVGGLATENNLYIGQTLPRFSLDGPAQ